MKSISISWRREINELYIYEGYFGIKKLSLTDLEDVNPAETIIENSSTLVYDANDDVWKITAPAPPRNSLSDLNDVFVDGGIITENDTLVYNANLGKFVLGQVEMDVRFDNLRPDHARFDIFINGQFILDTDYIFEQNEHRIR